MIAEPDGPEDRLRRFATIWSRSVFPATSTSLTRPEFEEVLLPLARRLSDALHTRALDADEGRAVGADVRADFLERSSLMVWEAVELNTEHVVRGYQTTQDSLDEIRSAAFDQLLTGGELEPSAVEDAARVLGLPTEGSYHCLVGAFPIPRPEVLAECSAALQASGRAFYFSWWARELRGVV
uniref:hypothetical protein n=1 Tax=Streptomyces sp. DSM 41540 TaxID=3448657 RepID=UPI00403FDFE6